MNHKKFIIVSTIVVLSAILVVWDMLEQPINYAPKQEIVSEDLVTIPSLIAKNLMLDEEVNINALEAPVKLVHFWASWCTVCMAEMKDLIDLTQKMNGKIKLVTISIDNTKQAAQGAINRFKKERPNTWYNSNIEWLFDEGKKISIQQMNVVKTPETFVLNKHNQITEKIVGAYEWNSNKAIQMMGF